jgi:hypothetical protein
MQTIGKVQLEHYDTFPLTVFFHIRFILQSAGILWIKLKTIIK